MTSRPHFAPKRRPLSAIFLGSNPSPSPPDLPEPPSPGASSTDSGLPSPPATNSTGSGSTDDNIASGGSLRRRSASDTVSSMLNGNYDRHSSRNSRTSSPDEEDGRKEEEEEEDNTARMAQNRRRETSSDHVMALQRVMSLTQRNRMALDKLSSMSRLGTPSPSTMSRASRSSLPPLTGDSSASGSSSHDTSHSQSNSASGGRSRSHTLSGSETERESQHMSSGASYTYSSDEQSATPPSSVSNAFMSASMRRRRVSLPDSPSKRPPQSRSPTSSPAPSSQRTPRKRVSVAMSDSDQSRGGDETHNITAAALAAVASLRRSPTSSGKKTRQPLPREFREPKKASSDGRASGEVTTPQKFPRERHSTLLTRNASPSPRSARFHNSSLELSPHRPSNGSRPSTVRDMARRHQTRWMSEDLSSVVSGSQDDGDEPERPSTAGIIGRRQATRSGSMESSLGARLVGDSLRAAGITMRRDSGNDVFTGNEPPVKGHRRPRSSGTASTGHPDWEDVPSIHSLVGPSRLAGSSRQTERSGLLYDPRTPGNVTSHYRTERGAFSGPQPRPATSMANYRSNEDMPPPRTAPSGPRTHKSTYAVDRDREGIGSTSRAQLYPQLQAPPFQERTYGSPRVRPRPVNANPPKLSAADEQAIEHLRLMDDSLTNFETLLSRLPSMGETTTVTVPELYRNAQNIVRYSEQVNGMLRAGTNRALEHMIESELEDGEVINRIGLWKDIGGDFRDCLRVSDELVRTMTGFLLGAGRVLRESAAYTNGASGNGGPGLQHLRAQSDDLARRAALDARSSTSGNGTGSGKGSASGDGRRSADSRRSLDAVRTEREKADLLRRVSSRADGILAGRATLSLLRDRESPRERVRSDDERSPPPNINAVLRPLTSNGLASVRRTYAPRESREQRDYESSTHPSAPPLTTIESQDSLHEWEPSPTPAPRNSVAGPGPSTERHRMLPPLSIPAPLPALPSESLLSRRISDTPGSTRRKISIASNITVRAVNPPLNIAPPSATTAITPHTVSISNAKSHTPDRNNSSLSRTDSASASDSSSKKSNNVTFSRPLAVSVSELNGLQQRDTRSRFTLNSRSDSESMPQSAISAASPAVWTPRSGSETERPPRATLGRRTLGPRSRISLDAPREEEPREGGASQAQTVILPARKGRRRTITEIFS